MDKIATLKPFTVDDLQHEIQRRIKVKMGTKHSNTISVICDHFNTPLSDVFSQSRKKEIQRCRNIAYYILHKHYKLSCCKTANMLDKKTHGAVLSGCRKIQNLMKDNRGFKNEVKSIINKLEAK